MAKFDSTEFQKWDKELIKLTLTNRVDINTINLVYFLRENIQSVLDDLINDDYPEWFIENLTVIISEFLKILNSAPTIDSQSFSQTVFKFRTAILYDKKEPAYPLINYPLPFLENYAKTFKISRQLSDLDKLSSRVDESIRKIESDGISEITLLEEKFNTFKAEADGTLSLLNKQAGRIGVKDYAEIFEKQAFEHSRFPGKDESGKFKFKGFGKSQLWLFFATVAFSLLIISFTQLDNIFSLKDKSSFTPEVTVHIAGRFLLISLFIFIVSFSFKQFRINMHLYTLNKHRANTLKSFEYLTRAPDQLAPESYNAILMEVAKAIYEAGQTGYISTNEGHSDMPSIIDMSKVFTQPKN